MKDERTCLSDTEKEMVVEIKKLVFRSASITRRFCNELDVKNSYTQKQKNYIHFIFKTYCNKHEIKTTSTD